MAAEYGEPDERAGVVELLGVLAYGELTAFERIAGDAGLAPTLQEKAALAALSVAQFRNFELVRGRLAELGVAPEEAMAPFREAVDAFHRHTAPADYLEGVVKAYVGDGIADDFYREVAVHLDAATRDLVLRVLDDSGHAAFAVEHVRAAIAANPRVGGRLALWGRRLVGEALSQAQRVAVEHDALARLIVGGAALDLAELGRVLVRLTERHAARMAALGLRA